MNKIEEDQEMRETKVEKHSKFSMQERMQQFEKAMQIFSQMLTRNKVIESVIPETIKELQDE